MRWVVDGKLIDMQGCIERALDIIKRHGWQCEPSETGASAVYKFTHSELGDAGQIKLTAFPRDRTEVYGYEPDPPTDRWLVEYLPNNIPPDLLGQDVQALLNGYARQIEQGIFELSSVELYHIALTGQKVEFGFQREGLGKREDFTRAREDLDEWRKKLHDRRKREFEAIARVIETVIRHTPLAFSMWVDGQRIDIPLPTDEEFPIPDIEQAVRDRDATGASRIMQNNEAGAVVGGADNGEARDIAQEKTPLRQPGRPHIDDDIWAHDQVNVEHRPLAEVYAEWNQRDGVIARNLADPERQFKRIIDPSWGTKSGQNV